MLASGPRARTSVGEISAARQIVSISSSFEGLAISPSAATRSSNVALPSNT